MPVYKDEKRGTWYVDVHYTDQNGKSRHITRRGFKRKGDAKAAEEDVLRNLADNLPSSMTLDELVDQFNKNYAIEGIKESTMISNYSVYKQHIHKQLGSTKVKSIKAKTVMEWMSDLIAKEKPDGKKYSENTINNTKMTGNSIYCATTYFCLLIMVLDCLKPLILFFVREHFPLFSSYIPHEIENQEFI